MSPLPVTTAAPGTVVDPVAGPATVLSMSIGSVPLSDALAWTAIGAFVVAAVIQWYGATDPARYLAAGAWVVFGVFWLTLAPHYYLEVKSPIETLLTVAALPLCAYTGYLLATGRESLLLLSKAVAFMGLIYLPVETIPVVRTWLIETTAAQTHFGMELLGHSPGLEEGANGYQSRFAFDPDETVTGRTTYIITACTGIGSMAIFGGLIAAVKAPLKRKAVAFPLAVGVIWFLNLVRNVFIGLASPWGWFQQDIFVTIATEFMGAPADRTSYIVAHNFIAQSLSIVALLGITYLVLRILPEILEPLEDVLYILTGTEYDLADALGQEMRTDGGARTDAGASADHDSGPSVDGDDDADR
ncbi:archaeosortase A [Natrinema thermotolerans]|uniref:Archaeosortase A n=1 Tax=Natrinema thermotolerans TaxID=121872 RepID=A0AAF0PDF9_9EURY|nr:archaeosortase A [Natrinema thermotolerans]QCC58045.1 archaeosortase A [Natrinema thermotolerans]WMT09145.1 archaeosortase A [Natrinema thermotolerans]